MLLLSTPITPLCMISRLWGWLSISQAECVLAQADLSEGHRSHGEMGWVKAVGGSGALLTVTVGYHESESGWEVDCSRKEKACLTL
jgi:hypothetical protein